jgi:hypothetical protein
MREVVYCSSRDAFAVCHNVGDNRVRGQEEADKIWRMSYRGSDVVNLGHFSVEGKRSGNDI